jgi:hypothetical protein
MAKRLRPREKTPNRPGIPPAYFLWRPYVGHSYWRSMIVCVTSVFLLCRYAAYATKPLLSSPIFPHVFQGLSLVLSNAKKTMRKSSHGLIDCFHMMCHILFRAALTRDQFPVEPVRGYAPIDALVFSDPASSLRNKRLSPAPSRSEYRDGAPFRSPRNPLLPPQTSCPR